MIFGDADRARFALNSLRAGLAFALRTGASDPRWLALQASRKFPQFVPQALRAWLEPSDNPFAGISLRDAREIQSPDFRIEMGQGVRCSGLGRNTRPPVPLSPAGSGVRVLHVLTSSLPYTQSGYSLRSHAVLKAQRQAGIDARALTRLNYPLVIGAWPREPEREIDGVRYRAVVAPHWPGREADRLQLQAQQTLTQLERWETEDGWRPDLIHTTTDFRNALVAQAVAGALDIPWVYETRGERELTWLQSVPPEQQPLARNSSFFRSWRDKETQMTKSAAAVVALSNVQREGLIARGISPEKISVVPNALWTSEIGAAANKSAARAQLGLPESAAIFGSISSVVPYEGFETAIEALAKLRSAKPESDWHFILVGSGTALPALKSRAEELALGDCVHFVGKIPQSEIGPWYDALDCFVIPRVDSPLTRSVTPIKGLQAAAHGIPIVASDLPALKEVTPDEPAGMLVPPSDPSALAAAIQRATSTEPAALAASAQEFARARTWEANAERYNSLYHAILS